MMMSVMPFQVRHSSCIDYEDALMWMRHRVQEIDQGEASECLWLLEHPSIYTGGRGAKTSDLLQTHDIPVVHTDRGGQYTYHGPGQRIGYVMLNIRKRQSDIRHFVWGLEEWMILTLKACHIVGERRPGRIGIWIVNPITHQEQKIASIGVRVSKGITSHGIALNVNPNLDHFRGIIPCGLQGYGVTSLEQLGCIKSMDEIDQILTYYFKNVFLS